LPKIIKASEHLAASGQIIRLIDDDSYCLTYLCRQQGKRWADERNSKHLRALAKTQR